MREFLDTKWYVYNWTTEMKKTWQDFMFSLGYSWSGDTDYEELAAAHYFVNSDGCLGFGLEHEQLFFEERKHVKKVYRDIHPYIPQENKKPGYIGYIVWSPSARTNPKKVHATYSDAALECERLVKKTQTTFHVAELSEPCVPVRDFKWGDDI